MEYDIWIGLETHIEHSTKTKMFCGCKNEFGAEPNSNVCPVCLGMPGSLPVINRQAVINGIKAGLATNCTIAETVTFDRKHYFYPDLPKAYQTTQGFNAIATNGFVEIEVDGVTKRIPLKQIHLEEDAGKLLHEGFHGTMVDYNRGGVPLCEIVTDCPGLSSAKEVMIYLETLKETFKALEISECRMERGHLRCDVNISLKPKGSKKYGVRTEMKNLNSFKAIERAIAYEVERQKEILDNGGKIVQETLRWDDDKGINYSLRSKEDAHDYRYFPEPDLPPIVISREEIEQIRKNMPVFGKAKRKVYVDMGLTSYDAEQLTRDPEVSRFFDETVKAGAAAKQASNWIQVEVMKIFNEEGIFDIQFGFSPGNFAKLLKMTSEGKINQQSARIVLKELFKKDEDPENIVKRMGLASVTDEKALEKIVLEIIDKNPNAVNDYKSGNQKAFAFFIGQTMKATQGKADAAIVNAIVKKLLTF